MKKVLEISMSALLILCVATGMATADPLLIVHTDYVVPTAEFTLTGRFSAVDAFDARAATPTLDYLKAYPSVLVYTYYAPTDPTALGDVLADYVDAGGHLAIADYAFWIAPFGIGGRIMTNGYSPLVNLGTPGGVSGNLVATVADDPLFTGINLSAVTYFYDKYVFAQGLASGATLLATDGAGIDMIAVNGDRSVFGFNLWPSSHVGGNNPEFYNLLANGLVPESTVVPVPAAVLLGLLGLGAAGVKLRKHT